MSEPSGGWREEVKLMIDLAIARFHGENVERLTTITGTLKRQDEKLEDLAASHKNIDTKLDSLIDTNLTLLTRSNSWDKATFYKNARIWLGIIFTILALILSYLGLRAKLGHEISKSPSTVSQNFNATVQ